MPSKVTIIIGFCLLIACMLAGCGHKINPWLSPATIPLKDGCIYLTGRLDFNNKIAHAIHTRNGIRYIINNKFDDVEKVNVLVQETNTGGKCMSHLTIPWISSNVGSTIELHFTVIFSNNTHTAVHISKVSSLYTFNVRPERYYPWPFWPWDNGPSECCINFYRISIAIANPIYLFSHYTTAGVRACASQRCATLWWPRTKKALHHAPFSSLETNQ